MWWQGARGSEGVEGSKGVILGFRVPTTSVGARGEVRGVKGSKGSEAYCILGFRVPTTSMGARGEGATGSKGSEVGQRGAKGVKGSERATW